MEDGREDCDFRFFLRGDDLLVVGGDIVVGGVVSIVRGPLMNRSMALSRDLIFFVLLLLFFFSTSSFLFLVPLFVLVLRFCWWFNVVVVVVVVVVAIVRRTLHRTTDDDGYGSDSGVTKHVVVIGDSAN